MKILVCQPVTAEMKTRFESQFSEHEFIYNKTPKAADFAQIGAIFGSPEPKMLKFAEKLQFLQLSSAGAEKYNDANVVPHSVALCCTTGIFGREIGEVLLSMLLSLNKHLHIYRDRQSKAHWEFFDYNRPLSGSRVLILGLGDIGQSFAQMLTPFSCEIIGVRHTAREKPDCVDEIYGINSLDALLPRADVVAMCLPETAETKSLMTRERIFAMKSGSILLNIGRGSAVDNLALADALNCGHLFGAGIDVVDIEPLPTEHPLWNCENAIITPHVAGRSYSPYIISSTGHVFIQNFSAFLSGEALISPVDRATGYMKSRK